MAEQSCTLSIDYVRELERRLVQMTAARDYEKAAHQRTRDFYENAKVAQEVDSLEDAMRRIFSGATTVRLSEACIQRLQIEMRETIGPELDEIRAALRRTLAKLAVL